MCVIEIEGVDTEPAPAAGGLPCQDRLRRSNRQEFRGDDEVGALDRGDLRERCADDPLRSRRPVCLGGIDQGYPELDRLAQQRRGDLRRVSLAVAPLPGAELPGSEPDLGDSKPACLHVTHELTVATLPVSAVAAAIVRISGARTVRAVEQANLAVREHHIQATITGFEMPESMVREIVTMAMVRRPSPMGLPV